MIVLQYLMRLVLVMRFPARCPLQALLHMSLVVVDDVADYSKLVKYGHEIKLAGLECYARLVCYKRFTQ